MATLEDIYTDRALLCTTIKQYWDWDRLACFNSGQGTEHVVVLMDIKLAISRLSETHKKVLFLNYIMGYSEKGTGEMVGVSQPGVNGLVNEAVEQIQKFLQDDFTTSPV